MDVLHFENQYRKDLLLFTPDEAINLGNLFKDLYMSYKGFSNYCFNAKNDKEKLLFELQKYNFCIHELNLYLDTNKSNNDICYLFNKYLQKSIDLTNKYEEEYGPLTAKRCMCNKDYIWKKGPWPWEN